MISKKKDLVDKIAKSSTEELEEMIADCRGQARRIGVWPIVIAGIAWIALYSPILQLFVRELRERRAALFWHYDLYGPLTSDQIVKNVHDIDSVSSLIDWSPLIVAVIAALIAAALLATLVHIRRNYWRKRLDSCTKQMEIRAAKQTPFGEGH